MFLALATTRSGRPTLLGKRHWLFEATTPNVAGADMAQGRSLVFCASSGSWRVQRADQFPLSALASVSGYADQAHLSREVRRLSGLTPAAVVAQFSLPHEHCNP